MQTKIPLLHNYYGHGCYTMENEPVTTPGKVNNALSLLALGISVSFFLWAFWEWIA